MTAAFAGAASGAIFSTFGLFAPPFTAPSTSFLSNLGVYLRKAGYAALTGALSASGSALIYDYADDQKINNDFVSYYCTIMGLSGVSAGLASFGGSVYDYLTWDKYTTKEKIMLLQKEFKTKIVHTSTQEYYGLYDPRHPNQVSISDKALTSRGLAMSTVYHELVHKNDFKRYIWDAINQGTPLPDPGVYQSFTERNAYAAEMAVANKFHLSINEWRISAEGALYYNAPWYSYFGFFMPMILRLIF